MPVNMILSTPAARELVPWGRFALAALPDLALQTDVPLLDRFLALLADPNVAYLLLVMGLLGLAAEFATGGTVFPGVAGVICLILALAGLGQLPTNWAGAALILAGITMLVLDIQIIGFGLSIGGVVAFALGSLLLFTPPWIISESADSVRINPWLLVGTTGGVAAFFFLAIAAVVKSRTAPVAVGRRILIGKIGTVREALGPRGIVHAEGETWSAVSVAGTIPVGAQVQIVDVRGLTLYVRPADATPPEASD